MDAHNQRAGELILEATDDERLELSIALRKGYTFAEQTMARMLPPGIVLADGESATFVGVVENSPVLMYVTSKDGKAALNSSAHVWYFPDMDVQCPIELLCRNGAVVFFPAITLN